MSDERNQTVTEIEVGVSDLVSQVASYRALLLVALEGWHGEKREHERTRERLYATLNERRAERSAA